MSGAITKSAMVSGRHRLALAQTQVVSVIRQKRRIKQTPPTSRFKGLTSNQIRKLKKEN